MLLEEGLSLDFLRSFTYNLGPGVTTCPFLTALNSSNIAGFLGIHPAILFFRGDILLVIATGT